MAPISWGKLFSVSGTQGPESPATLSIALGDALADDHVYINGQAQLLDLLELSVQLDVNDAGFKANVQYQVLALDVILKLSYEAASTKGRDLSLYADVNTDMLDNVTKTMVAHLTSWRQSLDSDLQGAQSKVHAWEQSEKPKLTANQAEIAQLKAKDTAAFSAVESKLYDAKQAVAGAEAKVDSLQSSIADDQNAMQYCASWTDVECESHNAWLQTKIAAPVGCQARRRRGAQCRPGRTVACRGCRQGGRRCCTRSGSTVRGFGCGSSCC